MTPRRGLYEELITEVLEGHLSQLGDRLEIERLGLRKEEAADRLALHLSRVIRRAIAAVDDRDRVEVGISLARKLIDEIDQAISSAEVGPDRPVPAGEVLRSVLARLPDGRAESIPAPLIPLLDTALLTNAPGEPRVGHQVLTEIHSADRVDLVMAFIRRSGIAPMLPALRAHCSAGRPLRILTTTYTQSTELAALEQLCELGAEVKVSYDTSSTRLHAKAWLFHRESGFSTAYIGSSNLTHSAQISGLEWNLRVSGARNPDVIEKIAAVFESYWCGRDFVPFKRDEFLARMPASEGFTGPRVLLSPVELRPEPFQERLLEQIALSREKGHHRNLLVSATGTGKTVMAALDYARLREELPKSRLLFVAHREEILEQSLATFRYALRDPSFGELWVGGHRPSRFEHVFASVQSPNVAGLDHLDPAHFDVVVIDEFHHAAARSYRTLLEHLRPVELLGLTATPERSDGLPVLEWFDHRIAAELRLWDAIDQHRLVPFSYFGIHDGLDLRAVPWKRGRGYEVDGLTRLLTADDIWAKFVLEQLNNRVDRISSMRALGFCVSVEHARFMARVFREHGVASVAVWSDTPDEERRAALADLAARRVNVVFSVDLFNEGVDVPAVDTLLMLRPTDSPTLFLQQLGRGLRRSPNKAACTVLDFVGHHRTEFRFDRKFRALLGGSRKDLQQQVEDGFPFLPAGCHLELDPIARERVLENIKAAVPTRWKEKAGELHSLAKGARTYPLARFIEETGLELEDVYAGERRSWSDLCELAGLQLQNAGPEEQVLRRASARFLHVDDRIRLEAYQRFLSLDTPPTLESFSIRDRRLLRMLVGSLMDQSSLNKFSSVEEGLELLWKHPQVIAELRELFGLLADRIGHVPYPLRGRPEVPLVVHARYSRLEILAAFGIGEGAKVSPWQTGVYWSKEANADLFAFTLDKTSGQFSPTTRYRDYAISRELIHWESQSVTRADSETGLRYRHHISLGTAVMLFARLRSDERSFYFLGPAHYVKHDGERPMAVTWRLEQPLSGDLFASFAAAVA